MKTERVPACDLSVGQVIVLGPQAITGIVTAMGQYVTREHFELEVDGLDYEVYDGDSFLVEVKT